VIAPLHLDFERRVFGPAWRRTGLLALGLVALLSAVLYERFLSDEIQHREGELGRMQEQARARQPQRIQINSRNLPEEIKRAKEVIQHLTLPWTQLFRAVESSDRSSVALLALQPDATKQRLVIGGEAKNFNTMLDYVRSLERSGALQRVTVTGHEIQLKDPLQPVRFTLEASWVLER
jgi:Tfp pilus assembly protein PilN